MARVHPRGVYRWRAPDAKVWRVKILYADGHADDVSVLEYKLLRSDPPFALLPMRDERDGEVEFE
jgi:hypothetical protein